MALSNTWGSTQARRRGEDRARRASAWTPATLPELESSARRLLPRGRDRGLANLAHGGDGNLLHPVQGLVLEPRGHGVGRRNSHGEDDLVGVDANRNAFRQDLGIQFDRGVILGDFAEVLGDARGAGADGGNVRLWGLAGIGGLG